MFCRDCAMVQRDRDGKDYNTQKQRICLYCKKVLFEIVNNVGGEEQ